MITTQYRSITRVLDQKPSTAYTRVMEGFGTRLAAYRKERGLSQKALAEAVGATDAMIRRYEGAEYYPRTELLVRIADVLDCGLDELLGRKRAAHKVNARLQHLVEVISTYPKAEQRTAEAVLEGLVLRHLPKAGRPKKR